MLTDNIWFDLVVAVVLAVAGWYSTKYLPTTKKPDEKLPLPEDKKTEGKK